MNLEYDNQVDAAYISLAAVEPVDVKVSYACDPDEVGGQIQLDFDGDGRLIGIEVLDASHMLPEVVLKAHVSPK